MAGAGGTVSKSAVRPYVKECVMLYALSVVKMLKAVKSIDEKGVSNALTVKKEGACSLIEGY